jgi:hypothetical protein
LARGDDGHTFLFHIESWRGSKAVQRMSFAEKGMYLEMMLEQWLQQTLPDDAEAVADAIANSEAQIQEVIAAWPGLRRKFVTVERQPGRIVNLKMEDVRRERRKWKRGKQHAGKEGGKARARNQQAKRDLDLKQTLAPLGPVQAECSSEDCIDLSCIDLNTKTPFEEFWSAYPRKVGKDDALKAWNKLKPTKELLGLALTALSWQCLQETWRKDGGQFVPYPATWLNRGSWKDEPVFSAHESAVAWNCDHTPRCPHRAACEIVKMRKVSA